jgi:hypothetical protein
LNQTTKPPLLVKNSRENVEHNNVFGEQLMEEKEELLKELKMTQTKMITMRERKIMREKKN